MSASILNLDLYDAETILRRDVPDAILEGIDKLVTDRSRNASTMFGAVLPYEISKNWLGTGGWCLIREFCESRLGEDIIAPYILLDVLLEAFKPGKDAGVWLGRDVVREFEPTLEFDDDGLLIGPLDHITFEKEGVLTPDHFLFYDRSMPGVGISGGFVEVLLATYRVLRPFRFGITLRTDVVLDRKFHQESNTRAYIRGPRGLKIGDLQNPHFPEDAKGTVTEHRALEDSVFQKLYPLERLEVMWSRRKGLKTVQLEELIRPRRVQRSESALLQNRYAHAIWNPETTCMEHFDGAIRGYKREQYQARLATDLKKQMQKGDKYRKLFRIDGALELDVWCDLLTRFYDQNELVLEYLGGAADYHA